MRAEIVLLAADGMNNCAIAATLGVSRLTVGPWRKRFAKKRFDGLDDEPRRGAPRKIDDEKITEVVTKALETMPADATHWSTRSMARTSGVLEHVLQELDKKRVIDDSDIARLEWAYCPVLRALRAVLIGTSPAARY